MSVIFDQPALKLFEKIDATIYTEASEASKLVAREIANIISARNQTHQNTVLGLATGSTPLQIYAELVRIHKEEGVSFNHVITFNLDEYYPMQPDELQSYVRFMHENLFDHIDIPAENIHIPDGTTSKKGVFDYCREYENKIEKAGGLDVQLLGIGRTGHIGFNEPGSLKKTRTRLVTLDNVTRNDAAAAFYGEEHVPRQAITMGVGTIMKSKKIYLLAWGEAKAQIVKRTLEGTITDQIPATFLQEHENVKVLLDEPAGSELTRCKTPWLVGPCKWSDKQIRRAVTWLSLKLQKPILKLSDVDYNQNGLSGILTEFDKAYNVNIKVFNEVQHTITGWPGGKPNADDSKRPEREKPFPKRVLIFSPHPSDDVISMGGTLMRLVEHGHDVHIAYQTTGNIGVYDDEALRYADFVTRFSGNDVKESFFDTMVQSIRKKQPGDIDSKEMLYLKTQIRRAEANSACRYCGVNARNIHFLEMPFYETGKAHKKQLSQEDIELVTNVIRNVKPHQIYAASDLTDPHGTYRICWNAIQSALNSVKNEEWYKDCYVWLYRGVWQDLEVSDIDMAVPLSPDERLKKRKAIFKHASQKDQPKYPGSMSGEFWMVADEQAALHAKNYDSLGLAEYDSIEGFTRFKE